MSTNGWDKLLCKYFYQVCEKVLFEYFSAHNFIPEENTIGGVIFKKKDIFFEVSYIPESFPNYSISMVIGLGTGSYDDHGRFFGVPLWRIVSENSVESTIFSQTFSNEEELYKLLVAAKETVVEKYAKPLWQKPDALKKELAK